VATLEQVGPIRDIEIACLACGERWLRGDPVCKSCGRPGGEHAQQNMTRHPRGTLLAVIGARDVAVCPDCDSEVIDAVRRGVPIPEHYRPRFMAGRQPTVEPVAQPVRPSRARRHAIGEQVTVPEQPVRRADPLADPTLRQAIAAYLEAIPDADAVALTLLGAALGPAVRLSGLDRGPDGVRTQLMAWAERDLGHYSAKRRREVLEEARQAFLYWSEQGWFSPSSMPNLENG
jgi:hypothetical protein